MSIIKRRTLLGEGRGARRLVRGAWKPELYEVLLQTIQWFDYHTGPNYRGFSALELRLLMEGPGSPNWPAQVKPRHRDRRLALMLGLDEFEGQGMARALRADVQSFGWGDAARIASPRMWCSHLQKMAKNGLLVVVAKGRYQLNQAFDRERLEMLRDLPSRYMARHGPPPVYGAPMVVNFRPDLLPEEEALVRDLGTLMIRIGDVLSLLQGMDKTRLPQATGKKVKRPDDLPWGAPHLESKWEFLTVLHGQPKKAGRKWAEEEYAEFLSSTRTLVQEAADPLRRVSLTA